MKKSLPLGFIVASVTLSGFALAGDKTPVQGPVAPPTQGEQQVGQGQQQVGQGQQQVGQGYQKQYIPGQYVTTKQGQSSKYEGSMRVFSYRGAAFGGRLYPNYDALRIALDSSYPIGYIEFYAHDEIGTRSEGELDIYIDGILIERDIDIKRAGRVHRIEFDRPIQASTLDLVARDDEVEVEWVDVGTL